MRPEAEDAFLKWYSDLLRKLDACDMRNLLYGKPPEHWPRLQGKLFLQYRQTLPFHYTDVDISINPFDASQCVMQVPFFKPFHIQYQIRVRNGGIVYETIITPLKSEPLVLSDRELSRLDVAKMIAKWCTYRAIKLLEE